MCPIKAPTLSTATDLTCSACALESRSGPVSAASNTTWNRYTRFVFDVTGTTVTTPRPSRAAVVLAPSLLNYHSQPDPDCSDPDDVTDVHVADFSATHQLLDAVGNRGIPRLFVTMTGPLIKRRRVVR